MLKKPLQAGDKIVRQKHIAVLAIVGLGLFFPLYAAQETGGNQTTDSTGLNKPSAKDSVREVSPTTEGKEYNAKTVLPEGVIFGSFTKDDGPYLITGNVIVPSGQTLEFGPACTVFVGGKYSTITVFGQMIARGTKKDPVVFMSSKKQPERWDWDRIYCRSRNRSVFKHCVIRNSNYGIFIENGAVSIDGCLFENNSLNGVAVKNADASIDRSVFRKGHAVAIHLLGGAVVKSDSLKISDNIAGIYCADSSSFSLRGGFVSNNGSGIISSGSSFIEIIGTEIIKNKTGVVTEREIPSKMKEMVYANTEDIKIVTGKELKALVARPQPVAAIILPATPTVSSVTSSFTSGFSALATPKEPEASFIGNVTTGFTYYGPQSEYHPRDRDTIEYYVPKENGTFDTVTTVKKVRNYQTKYPGEQSDKWYSGIQPEMQFFANGRRGATDINLLMDLYSNQWLSTSDYVGKNMFNLTMNYTDHQVVIGDFLESGSETSITGRQLTGIKYTGKKIDMGRGEKRFEFKLAAGETEVAKDSGDHEIFVYNQSVDTGMSKRQQITYITEATFRPTRNSTVGAKGIIAHDQYNKPLFRKVISDPAAFDPIVAQTGCFTGNVFLLNNNLELFGEVDLGSADTLTDSAAERLAWYNPEIQRAFPEVLSLFNPKDFADHSAGSAGARGTYKQYKGSIRYLQISPSYFSAGDPYLVTWRKNLLTEISRSLNEKIDLSGSYEFDRSIVEGVDKDGPPVITDLNIGMVDASYEFGGSLPSFSMQYTVQHQENDARESVEENDTTYTVVFKETEISNRIALEGKQSFKNGMAYSVRYQMLYDNDYGVHPDKSANDEGDRFHNIITGWYSIRYKRLLRNKLSVRFASKHENRDSLRAFQYKVANRLSLQVIPRKLSCVIGGEYVRKSEKEYEYKWTSPYLTLYYAGELEIKYSVTSRLSCAAMIRYEKSSDDLTGSSENYTAKIGGFHLTYLF